MIVLENVLSPPGSCFCLRYPLLIILIPTAFHLRFYGQQVFVIITLVVSMLFFYQFFQPWIQRRRLRYIKHEHLALDILKHMQHETMGELLTDNGDHKKAIEERDQDGDKTFSFNELKEFLQEIKFKRVIRTRIIQLQRYIHP